MSNPIATMQINISATIALLQRLRPNGSFIFISSSEVYCGLTESNFHEEHIGTTTPYHPRSSYIEGKKSGEAACNAFRSQGVRAISARLGDVYGPGTRKHDKRALNKDTILWEAGGL
jgi:nucleoside-diphosphate-sugar epimerase